MKFLRKCKECKSDILYTEKDKYIICPKCGFKMDNPRYHQEEEEEIIIEDDDELEEIEEIQIPKKDETPKKKNKFSLKGNKKALISIIASVSTLVLVAVIVLMCFAIPTKLGKSDAIKAYSKAVDNTKSIMENYLNSHNSGVSYTERVTRENLTSGKTETTVLQMAFRPGKYIYEQVFAEDGSHFYYLDIEENRLYLEDFNEYNKNYYYKDLSGEERIEEVKSFVKKATETIQSIASVECMLFFDNCTKKWDRYTMSLLSDDSMVDIKFTKKQVNYVEAKTTSTRYNYVERTSCQYTYQASWTRIDKTLYKPYNS